MGIEAAGLAQDAPEARGCAYPDMIFIPGGTFRMGSDRDYPERRRERCRSRMVASVRSAGEPEF